MLDIVMLALGLGFFVAAVGYTYACEPLSLDAFSLCEPVPLRAKTL